MRLSSFGIVTRGWNSPRRIQANTRATLLMAVLFLAGIAVGALVVYRTAQKPEAPVENTERTLSDSTRAVLESLKSPVQVQFYALFGEDTSSGELREFAARVKQLLTAFEQAAKGKINISPISSWSDDNARSAAAAGVVPVNAGGDAAYLGLVVGQKDRQETLAQLRPEWEAAIEFDLARAISRVAKPPQAQLPAADVAMAEKAAEAVQRTIPNLNSVSLEEGKRILRAAALEEYMAAVIGMEKEVNEAKQRVIKAEAGSSQADLQAAREQLRLIQARHAERLSQITARSQAQIEVFQRMK